MQTTLAIFGAGRLGQSWGRLAQLSGQYRIGSVCCRSLAAAQRAVDFIGAGTPCTLAQLPPLAQLNLLACADDTLPALATQMATLPRPDMAVAFHASGVLEPTVLTALADSGLAVGSLHPAFSFADPSRAVTSFAGTLCALQGEAGADAALRAFAAAIGGQAFDLPPGAKAAYHASLSIASNYLVTLTGLARSVAEQAGLPPALAGQLLAPLMHQSLDNALQLGAQQALTGPIMRGDVATVAAHLQALAESPDSLTLYKALGHATLPLTRLPADRLAALHTLLA
ncbi:Rossmann-like and DUF2520 domain-containing protein [Paludibacterium sp. THUN1379]|uniref:Rossmann-like and DUF2520 domain-containing protein n=1 Tax=Paludibacterium sp. THUN1379 TaxID=3112107 RepID=UPI00308C4D5F|nr:Rossmann-like and DUF2520 domain-containing protein [Paludibacterium sp. THUN1379]